MPGKDLEDGLLETFSLGNFGMTAISMVVNAAVTWVLVMLCQLLIKKK